ncbi:MAG TPA: septum formation initiator family protein [Bacteriovoracaceae bacterium]|nr:septum formation initiator family protein [Bacteriovoracaceae bacterium]
MNRSSVEEYEEVESPYAPKSSRKAAPRPERLRTRKDVFNRPFATNSSAPPAVFETTATRRSVGQVDNTEMIEHRPSELSQTQIEYLDEDEEEEETEEEVEKRPARSSPKKNAKSKTHILPKIGWAVIGLLVLRLIFMDRGVWDWFATENVIKGKKEELSSLQKENKSIKAEIGRIQIDKGYQKQLAKEHLGVIAADEFLILFAGETPESGSPEDRQI